jgi:hypothetical protein
LQIIKELKLEVTKASCVSILKNSASHATPGCREAQATITQAEIAIKGTPVIKTKSSAVIAT